LITAQEVAGLNPAEVTNKQYNKEKRQACLSVFLFGLFSARSAKDHKIIQPRSLNRRIDAQELVLLFLIFKMYPKIFLKEF